MTASLQEKPQAEAAEQQGPGAGREPSAPPERSRRSLRRTPRTVEPVRTYVPAPPWRRILSMVLLMVALVITGQVLNTVLISPLQHATAQSRLFADLRLSLSEGSAPLGQMDSSGQIVAPGTPLALLEIPELSVHEVIVEGTAGGQTMDGVGHRRDTVLPGQPGTSVLMGRSGAYGAVFGRLNMLRPGAQVTVTTGQGTAKYQVTGQRRPGDTAPAPPQGKEGRLTLITADGAPYLPSDVLRIDATLISPPFDKAAPVFMPGTLPASEQALGQDFSSLATLLLAVQVLILVAAGAVWSWYRWGRRETWLVFLPVLTAAAVAAGSQVNYLLPNLL